MTNWQVLCKTNYYISCEIKQGKVADHKYKTFVKYILNSLSLPYSTIIQCRLSNTSLPKFIAWKQKL